MISFSDKLTTVNETLFIMKGWYALFRPVMVPYDSIEQNAINSKFTVKKKKGVKPAIYEMAPMFGKGTIGVAVTGDGVGETITISGDFHECTIVGPYKQMSKAYQQIMKQYPKAKEFYNVYINSPKEVMPDKLETKVLFR